MSGQQASSAVPRETMPVPRVPEDVLAEVAASILGPGQHLSVDLLDILDGVVSGPVDAVRAHDDVLPRLAHDNSLTRVLSEIRRLLRSGGVFVAAVPELSKLGTLRPCAIPPRVTGRGDQRQVTVQLWDWADDGLSYRLDVIQLRCDAGGWAVSGVVSTHHQVLSAQEMSDAFAAAGFVDVRRLSPVDSGYPLPLWVAVTP